MIKKRLTIFETNSSSMHCFALIPRTDYERWKSGESYLYMKYEENDYTYDSLFDRYREPDINIEAPYKLNLPRVMFLADIEYLLTTKSHYNDHIFGEWKDDILDLMHKLDDKDLEDWEISNITEKLDYNLKQCDFYKYDRYAEILQNVDSQSFFELNKSIDEIEIDEEKYVDMVAVGVYGYDGGGLGLKYD